MKFEVTHAKKETQFLKLVFHLRCEEEEAYRIAKVECAHSKAKIEEREREGSKWHSPHSGGGETTAREVQATSGN